VTESIRQQSIEALTQRYLADADRLRVTPKQLIEILKEQAIQWKKDHGPDNKSK
jgi:hypothetical protein